MTGSSSLPRLTRLVNLMQDYPNKDEFIEQINNINNTITDMSNSLPDDNIASLDVMLLKKVVFKHYIFKAFFTHDSTVEWVQRVQRSDSDISFNVKTDGFKNSTFTITNDDSITDEYN